MQLTRARLERAAARGVIAPEQVAPLWRCLLEDTEDVPAFRFGHILYYLGGLIAIGAMSLFMNLGWQRFGGWGLFAIALAYAAGGLWLLEYLLRRKHLRIPAGIAGAFVVALTPLAVYGLQLALGGPAGAAPYRDLHIWVQWRWVTLEIPTVLVGVLLLWRYRLPFLLLPVAFALWYLSMDLAPLVVRHGALDWDTRRAVSLWFGLAMIAAALGVDLRTRRQPDYPFWLYLFGALAFWGGLSLTDAGGFLGSLGYLAINLLMIGVGAVLSRRVFVVLGGIGVAGYLWHLADDLFSNSLLFPFALTAIGLAIVWLGVLWQRHERALTARLRRELPASLRALLEERP